MGKGKLLPSAPLLLTLLWHGVPWRNYSLRSTFTGQLFL